VADEVPGQAPAAGQTLEIDYDKLAAALDRRAEIRAAAVPMVQLGEGPVDLGPYPHSFVDGVLQPHESGENSTDALARELAGLAPLDGEKELAAVPS
jgi:hypothetical protein